MRQDGVTIAPAASSATAIRHADSPHDVALARVLFVEYAQWLKVDLCFQGFDEELATLPGAYAPPRGRLLLAGTTDQAFGCIALRPLGMGSGCGCGASAEAATTIVAEVKRLYVQPAHRGEGWGERLARAVIDEARALGYRELKLDTLDWMTAARALYTGIGFRECAPYYHNPLPGVVYMALTL
ncbi:MAG: GNAT family N-acetyltransferase [Pseudomonadota bacterium]|nr:GNAT family N-acetyltransferase [Pseudomonadota bacterium]